MSGVDPLADQPFKSYVTPVFLSLVALLAILTAGLGEAQQDGLINNKPLKATSFLAIDPLPQGANSALRIDMELAPEFHAYLDKFKVQITNPEGLQISKFNITPVVEFEDVSNLADGRVQKQTSRLLLRWRKTPQGWRIYELHFL